jgi:hypothetical protein
VDTRTIYYIDDNEDPLEVEVNLALNRTPEENLRLYCEVIAANFVMMGIDVMNYPAERNIYYIEDE